MPHIVAHKADILDRCFCCIGLEFYAMDIGMQFFIAPKKLFFTRLGGDIMQQQDIHDNYRDNQ